MELTDKERRLLLDALIALGDAGDEREEEIDAMFDRLKGEADAARTA